MISPDLLKVLCCPETHQALRFLDFARVEQINGKIAAAKLVNRAGKRINQRIDGALIRDDDKFVYPIRNNIPVLLIDEAIAL